MFLVLRILRAFFGVSAGFQAVGVSNLIRSIFIDGAVGSDQVALFVIKTTILLILAGAFIGLRSLINYLHKKKFNKEHPALQSQWHCNL